MLCVSKTETTRHAGRRRALKKDGIGSDKTRPSSMSMEVGIYNISSMVAAVRGCLSLAI